MVTKEMWVDWRRSPVTQQFLQDLHETREALKEGLADGQSSSERQDCITQGQCMGLKDAIEYALKGFKYMEIENAEGSSVQSDSEG